MSSGLHSSVYFMDIFKHGICIAMDADFVYRFWVEWIPPGLLHYRGIHSQLSKFWKLHTG